MEEHKNETEPERVKQIEVKLTDGYYLQHWVEAVSDIMFLLQLYRGAAKRELQYWNAANEAEMQLESIEHLIEGREHGTKIKGCKK